MTDQEFSLLQERRIGRLQGYLDSIVMESESGAKWFTRPDMLADRLIQIASLAKKALAHDALIAKSDSDICQFCNRESWTQCHVCQLPLCTNHSYSYRCGSHCQPHDKDGECESSA